MMTAYEHLSNASLFEARRRIIYMGIDHEGKPAGEDQSKEIMGLMISRRIFSSQPNEPYDRGVRLLETDPYRAIMLFREAIEFSPFNMWAHNNLTSVLCNIGLYDEAVHAADYGRIHGFYFDLEYNRARALFKSDHRPSEYRSDVHSLFSVVKQCMQHGEAIVAQDYHWPDQERFVKAIINQCYDVAFVAGMNEDGREEVYRGPYGSISGARMAVDFIESYLRRL
jgi:hypothetical protein